jgi:hypothetical protein
MKSTTKPDVTTVKFNDSTVTFSFAVVASWKPVSERVGAIALAAPRVVRVARVPHY